MQCQFLSVKEAAAILGMSNKWVYKVAKRLPGYKVICGVIKFHTDTFLKGLRPPDRPTKD